MAPSAQAKAIGTSASSTASANAARIAAEHDAAEGSGREFDAAREAQAEADAAPATADTARDAAEAERHRPAVNATEVLAAADRTPGQRAAAHSERDRLVVGVSQARQTLSEAERDAVAAAVALQR